MEFVEIAAGRVVLCRVIGGDVSAPVLSGALGEAGFHYGFIENCLENVTDQREQFPVARPEMVIEAPDLRYARALHVELSDFQGLTDLDEFTFPQALKKVGAGDVLVQILTNAEMLCRYPDGNFVLERAFNIEDLTTLAGPNTTFSKADRCITADCKGCYHVEANGTVAVYPQQWLLEIAESADRQQYTNALHIAGDVINVRSLQLPASINVAGKIYNSAFSARGTISCGESIKSHRLEAGGLISAGDDISASDIGNCRVRSGGNIYVSGRVSGSYIEARDTIICHSLGNVEAKAGNRIIVQDILENTRIKMGYDVLTNEEYRYILEAIELTEFRVEESGQVLDRMRRELITLREKAITYVKNRSLRSTVPAAGPDLTLKRFCSSIRDSLDKYQQKMQAYQQALITYDDELPVNAVCRQRLMTGDPQIWVLGSIVPGTKIYFPDKLITIGKTLRRTVISYDERRRSVIFTPLDELSVPIPENEELLS